MSDKYGKFADKLGGYIIDKLPDAGNYEYIYKNDETLVKVDQYGIVTAQIDPPVGEAVLRRKGSRIARQGVDFGRRKGFR